jgi:hypothetical protein
MNSIVETQAIDQATVDSAAFGDPSVIVLSTDYSQIINLAVDASNANLLHVTYQTCVSKTTAGSPLPDIQLSVVEGINGKIDNNSKTIVVPVTLSPKQVTIDVGQWNLQTGIYTVYLGSKVNKNKTITSSALLVRGQANLINHDIVNTENIAFINKGAEFTISYETLPNVSPSANGDLICIHVFGKNASYQCTAVTGSSPAGYQVVTIQQLTEGDRCAVAYAPNGKNTLGSTGALQAILVGQLV